MSLNVEKKTIEAERLIGTDAAQLPLRAETAVSGAGKEPAEVLMTEASALIDGCEAQEGRIVAQGTLLCQAVYRQGGQIRSVTARASFSESFDMEEVTDKSIVRAEAAVEHAEAAYENGRMLFQATVALRTEACALEKEELVTGVTGAEGIEADFSEIRSRKLSAESAADALISQEVALPAELDARAVLMDWAQARVDKVEPDLGGVRVKGEAQAEALIITGVPGRPVALVKLLLPFDQLVELPEWLSADATAEASIRRLDSGVTAEGEEGAVLRLEAELRLKVLAHTTDAVTALSDVYATGNPGLWGEASRLTVLREEKAIRCAQPFLGTLMLETGAPGAGTILAVRLLPVLSGFEAEAGGMRVEGEMEAQVMYLPAGGGEIAAARGEIPFSLVCPGSWPPDARVALLVNGAEARALMSDRVEIKCALTVSGAYRQTQSFRVLDDVTESEKSARAPGLVIAWPGEGDSAWTLGKRYGVPVSRIVDMNGGSEKLRSGSAVILRV